MALIVQVENINGVLVTTSNRVAKELGVNHRDLLEKIDGYIKKFGSAENSAGFYILSSYIHPQNKQEYRNYLITKKGIAQLVGGYSSAVEKAFDLNVAYINKFEEMENKLQDQEALQYSELLSEIADLKKEINQFPISWTSLECIKDQIDETATRRMGAIGIDSKYFKTKLKHEIEKDVFIRLGVKDLQELKQKEYLPVI
ncbi:Rha family transcriptional regulator [uncultured Fusobacterium sp.]|uniref:Rha family transcriptional regulator n=1 Tax=uncultured Fusobacterium sp. TaxID=159267 RepID=UPI0025D8FE43|nr:Rha family transcriptional regulator [uncultured Fusobacterium sp.]